MRRGLMLLVVLGGCAGEAAKEAAVPEGAHPKEPAERLTAEPADDAPLSISAARLVPPADASAEVAFLASGTIRSVHVRVGDRVPADAPLVTVASPSLARLAAQWRSAVSQVRIARRRLKRLEALAAEDIASKDDLQARRAEIARLSGRIVEARGELLAHGVPQTAFDGLHRRGTLTLRAPVAGIVRRLNADVGERVGDATQPLAELVGEGRPRVEALLADPPMRGVERRFESSDGALYPVRSEPIATVPDPDTGSWRTWFELEGDIVVRGPRVGKLLTFSRPGQAVEIAPRALGLDAGEHFVVRKRDGAWERVPVRLLHLGKARAVVEGPLDPGDQVLASPRSVPPED